MLQIFFLYLVCHLAIISPSTRTHHHPCNFFPFPPINTAQYLLLFLAQQPHRDLRHNHLDLLLQHLPLAGAAHGLSGVPLEEGHEVMQHDLLLEV
jgi:hypothetical protein